MYEGYTHMANLFLSKLCDRDGLDGLNRTSELQEKIWQTLDEDSEVDGGVTRLTTDDLALRIFGHRAQKLQQMAEKVKQIYALG